MISRALVLAVSIGFLGCGKGDKAEPADKAMPAGPIKLDKVGLTIVSPGTTKVVVDDYPPGTSSVTLQGTTVDELNVRVADGPIDVEQAKKDASAFKPRNLKTETLPDGFALTYDSDGTLGMQYTVHAYRMIAGKSIVCRCGNARTAEQAAAALAACKTLKT